MIPNQKGMLSLEDKAFELLTKMYGGFSGFKKVLRHFPYLKGEIMKNSLVEIITRQINILFQNMQITLDEITDMQLVPQISDMPVWKHVYHTLHSLDQWFINPNRYKEPDFHIDKLNSLFDSSDKSLSKEELQSYFDSVKEKINKYLAELTDDDLAYCPEGYNFSRLELILGQIRHLSYHIGLIHCFIRSESGKWPAFMNLSRFIEFVNKNKLV
jgi:hypothetical protein